MGVLKEERQALPSGELSDSYLFTWGKVLHTKQPRLAWSMSQGARRQADTEYSHKPILYSQGGGLQVYSTACFVFNSLGASGVMAWCLGEGERQLGSLCAHSKVKCWHLEFGSPSLQQWETVPVCYILKINHPLSGVLLDKTSRPTGITYESQAPYLSQEDSV